MSCLKTRKIAFQMILYYINICKVFFNRFSIKNKLDPVCPPGGFRWSEPPAGR
jgi:hypothetical protein